MAAGDSAVTKDVILKMNQESNRLSTFKDWLFDDDCKSSAAKMAEAGFFHCPTKNEPDLVQCYVCFKELDGWECNDCPWEEHISHSKNCLFAKIKKKEKDLTVKDLYKLEAERHINRLKKISARKVEQFQENSLIVRNGIEKLV